MDPSRGPTPVDGNTLMLRFQAGDESAFDALFEVYHPRVHRLVWRYFQDDDLSRELTQETFLRVYAARAAYKPFGVFGSWIFGIAVHLCLNTLRNRRRETPLDADALEVPAPGPRPEDEAQRADTSRAVAAAVQSLPATQRALLILTFYEDLSIVDAAKVLGISAVSARVRLFRARRALKKLLADHSGTP